MLVTFGGSDPDNTTGRVVEALGELAEAEVWNVRVVVGSANEARAEIEALASRWGRVEVVVDPPDMGEHMGWAEVAVTAGGSTCWEFCYFGVPMVLISIAANQDAIVAALGKLGAGVDLGWHEQVEPALLAGELKGLVDDVERRAAMGAAAERLVDGRGADRVAAALGGALKISVATASEGWVADLLESFLGRLREMGHDVVVVTEGGDIPEGDVAFFLSFWSLVPAAVLRRNCHNLVVHASALPEGKGWSPLTWKILESRSSVPLTLFEAEVAVDSGAIYLQDEMRFEGHELLPELRERLMATTFALCERFVREYPAICGAGVPQSGEESFYRRRGPEDSRLDPERSIAEQFELLRTVDNERYPAFFEFRGKRYRLTIEKMP